MTDLVIDGKECPAREGATVLEAALEAGIYVPTLCYHPSLSPYGGCRLCVVEIEKMRGFPTACTTPAVDGMVIQTKTPQLQEFRRGVLELILTEHPHACLTCWRRDRCQPFDICLRNVGITERCVLCPRNGDCELQRIVDYIGIDDISLPYTYKELPVHRENPLIERDYNLCILCGRCVRACVEARGIGAISFTFRGSQALIGTAFDKPLQESGCRFCGACVEVCPTGALMDTDAIWHAERSHQEVAVPCHYACPSGINVPLYVYLIGEGKYQEALAIIREKVPFPGVLGRVCIHPCEQACRRDKLNEPISIKELKRFVADRDTGQWKQYSRKLPDNGKKVAVVGSGPAGLTAGYYLAKQGYGVTVFESLSKAGGMLRVGIPDYRLPVDILDAEINEIEQAGVEIKLNSRIESVDTLFDQGYHAVFLGLGAHQGMKMDLEGEDIPGVIDGAAFLRRVNLGEKINVGEKAAVIGGGNVAIDSARTALRLGAKEVTIIYRRTRAEMPASPEEIEAAIEENVEMLYLAAPLKVSQRGARLVLTCQRMELGEPDASGRRRPVPIKGSEFDIVLDTIIGAIGQRPEVPEKYNLEIGRGNTIQVDPETQTTSREGIWAGGDVASGPASVIEAIAAGRRAASAIDIYLGGDGVIDEQLTTEREIGSCGPTEEGFTEKPRMQTHCLPIRQRVDNFTEAELCPEETSAVAEGQRCFQCGVREQFEPLPLPPAADKPESPPEPLPVASTTV